MDAELDVDELNGRFGIPGALSYEITSGGLTRAVISTPAADAELYLQGAHLARWTPRDQRPVLYISPKSQFVPGKAIRGGIPIVFPWFGARSDGKPGPDHGFARILAWTMESSRLYDDGKLEVALILTPNDSTRELFPHDFQLHLSVTIGSDLEMQLETHNHSGGEFLFEAALHAYFAVGDVRQASISGLEGTVYIDKTDGFRRKTQNNGPLRIAKETDQVHLNTTSSCMVNDPVWNRRIAIQKTGSQSTVIWNPWIDKTAGMADMAADSWISMVCVEVANASDNAVLLTPGSSHKMTATIRVI